MEFETNLSVQLRHGRFKQLQTIGSDLPAGLRVCVMAEMDPVEWDVIEAVVGPPAPELQQYVDGVTAQFTDEGPFRTVKTVYDAWKSDQGNEPSIPDQGAAMLVTYLLERRDGIDLGRTSVIERRPSSERLRELFSEQEYTMWWIATLTGVHWVVVRYWLWEDDIALRERNFGPETMDRIREYESEE